jgi:DNA-binding transcriptional MerR regulator
MPSSLNIPDNLGLIVGYRARLLVWIACGCRLRTQCYPSSALEGQGESAMKIGEVAQLTGTPAKTIRFYEQAGLLPAPARSESGYRDYEPRIVDRLRFIHRGQAAGLSLREIGQILAIRDRGEAPCGHVQQVLRARLDQVRAQQAELVALEGHLDSLLRHATRGAPVRDPAHDQARVCWILETDPADSVEPDRP